MTGTTVPAHHCPRILRTFASINQLHVRLADEGEHIFGCSTQLGLRDGCKNCRRVAGNSRLQRALLTQPLVQAAVEHDDIGMAVVVERPPEAGGELRCWMRVIGHDKRVVSDTQASHDFSKTLRRCDLRFNRVVEVNDVMAPVDIDRAGNMALFVFSPCADIFRVLHAVAYNSTYIAAHIDDTKLRVMKMLG